MQVQGREKDRGKHRREASNGGEQQLTRLSKPRGDDGKDQAHEE